MRLLLQIFLLLGVIYTPLCYGQEIKPNTDKSIYLIEMYTLLQQYRVAHDVPSLNFDTRLTEVADYYGDAILKEGTANIKKKGFSKLIRQNGYASQEVNLIISGSTGKPAKFIDDWQAESYKNILANKKYQDVGIAYVDAREIRTEKPELKLPRDIWIIVVGKPSRKVAGDWGQRILDLVNEFRAEHDLPPLMPNIKLARASQYHADDMAMRDYFSHFSPEGKDIANRVTRFGYRWRKVLENLAGGQGTPRAVVEGWKASKAGHREAMIDPDVTQAGLGYHYLPVDTGQTRFTHYWALSMGLPLEP